MDTPTTGKGDSAVLSRQESSIPSGKRKSKVGRSTSWWAGGLLVPVLTFFVLMNVIPTIWMLGLSFYNYQLTSAKQPKFIGFDNYAKVINDGPISNSVSYTHLTLPTSDLV